MHAEAVIRQVPKYFQTPPALAAMDIARAQQQAA